MNYRVVWITKNIKRYPTFKQETEEFPHLVEYVDDECDGFVVNENDESDFYPVNEFFQMVNVKKFHTEG